MAREYGRLRKRIMLNLDGTGQAAYSGLSSNNADGKVTSAAVSNVARIGRAALLEDVENGFEQIVYYQSGVASGAESGKLQSLREGGFGVGLVSNVREAYGFLCNNYDFHDEIYITGFSRGAFTARSVAGLIGKVGILTKKGLDNFYEAFDYYEHPENWKNQSCPVLEETGTTRKFLPGGKEKQEITIRAVGVWDTVGALVGDYAFHDVTLGKHIENGFHMLSLNEKRAYFEPTLWDASDNPRTLEQFEQCWMPGDHSNVGGSWDDQQLADISLAWMMSRLEVLGLKFDHGYLYREFLKFNRYVNRRVKEQRNEGDDPKYSSDLCPRQWGEGRSREISPTFKYGGEKTRTPMMYCHPEKKLAWIPWNGVYFVQSSRPLEKTNETFHPLLRYRHYCSNEKTLGAQDHKSYETKSLDGWTWPTEQLDGRIGSKRSSASTSSFTYTKNKGKETVKVQESRMGYYEQLLLAIYDQDPALREAYEGSIWKKVLGGEGPPQDIKATVSEIVADPANALPPPASKK